MIKIEKKKRREIVAEQQPFKAFDEEDQREEERNWGKGEREREREKIFLWH